nr:nuclear transcription factor Y subunit B-5 [Ipomoea batatas]
MDDNREGQNYSFSPRDDDGVVERERADELKAAGNNGGMKALAEEPAADDDDNYLKGEAAIIRYSSSATTSGFRYNFMPRAKLLGQLPMG